MPVSVPEFWKLLLESRLAPAEQVRQLQEKFSHVKGAGTQSNATTLAEWLVAQGVLSRYQAKVLTAGRPGPFRFGEYVVYDRHGGPFKGAFKAIHPATRHQVVLSFFTGQAAQNPHWWSIIVQQMVVFAHAVHPHVCRVFQLCDTGSYKFAVLEYVRGQSAADRLTAGTLRWPEACRMVRQAALGLVRLLELGQLHGEVRPANLWIDRQENAKLLLPPLARDPLALPGPINFAGADPAWLNVVADYLAPELAQPGQAPSAATDIYALGCTLFQLIAGRVPFAEGDVVTKLRRHAAELIASLEPLGVPSAVMHVLASMTAKNPALRYQHPQLVADTLAGVLQQFDAAQLTFPASPPAPTLPAFETWLHQQSTATAIINGGGSPSAVATQPSAGVSPPPVPSAHEPIAPSIPSEGSHSIAAAMAAAATTAVPTTKMPVLPSNDFGKAASMATSEAEEVFVLPASVEGTAASKVSELVQSRRAKQRRNTLIGVAALAVCAVAGAIAWAVMNRPPADSVADGSQAQTDGSASNSTDESSASDDPSKQEADDHNGLDANGSASGNVPASIVPDDGNTLWASPTNGSPCSLAYVGPAAQAFLFLRPADLMKHAEGNRILAALGPSAEIAQRNLEATIGGPLSDIEQLTVAWIEPSIDATAAAAESHLAPMYVVRFSAPRELEKLLEPWGNPKPTQEGAEQFYQTSQGAAYLPAGENRHVLVVGPLSQIRDSIQLAGKPPPIRRDLEKLLLATDDQRLATFLFASSSRPLERSALFAKPWDALFAPVQSFLGNECRAAEITAHLTDDSLFLELRAEASLDTAPETVVQQYRQQLAQLPEGVENFIAALDPQPYGRRVLLRFPRMVGLLDEYTRGGIESGQAVLRCYLPAAAAHNLLLGTELALLESTGPAANQGSLAAAGSASGKITPPPQSVAEKLKQTTSLRFNRDTLEKALNLLADDVGVPIEILGADLQLEGITKNQSFGLDERDKPAEEILRNMMLKANPDGKLVYVVKPKEPGGEETLFVTTRAAAAKRGDKLPPELTEGK